MAEPGESIEAEKRAAAEAAVTEVVDGMLIGLGTGTTAAHAIAAIGRRVAAGLRIEAVATSEQSAAAARALGITVRDFADVAAIDLAIDGVDEIDPGFRAIKGAGGAMLREKIVAASAARMIVVADHGKAVTRLGVRAVPVEVLPFARSFVADRIAALGGEPVLRQGADGSAWRSDQGNLVLDCRFGIDEDWRRIADALAAIPGQLGHGLFLDEIDALYLATADGVKRRDRTASLQDE